ncbi:DUF488 domain-containing protein [Thiohalobacter sp. IOR34]|uniref:DUF488 domain-containing protein n=1 Tax=Thiohalobacter sp. IOR34 TaxID=3057176 RepID=UPI0025B0C1D9|nr:DUF488 domain-containing protein [Thiohalobacter sp. IOR34]WJW74638.1 DUF488 domain-containing protein [Thiohalobacter sp. IOR34]
MNRGSATLFTIGHSNRELAELLELLGAAAIRILVEVRARPRSQRFPQFDEAALRAALEGAGIEYHWAGRQLGGRRPARPGSPHLALEAGFRGYADHMASPDFHRAMNQLLGLAGRAPLALLCAERLPEHCHRSLIADWLLLQGHSVVHLIDTDQRREHQLRPEARRDSAALVYDRYAQPPLDL